MTDLPYRWTILAVGTTAQAVFSAIILGIPVLAPALRDAYGLSLAEVGAALAALNLGITATLLGWGLLTDRVGERVVIVAGLGLSAVALAAASATPRYLAFVALLVAAGMAGASVSAASGRAVMGWFARRERGLALGIRQSAVPLGGALAALGLPLVVAAWDLRGALLALAAACLAGALAAGVWLREPPSERLEAPGPGLVSPFRDPRVWRLCLASAALVSVQVGIASFVVLFLEDERGFSTGEAAGVLAAIQVAGGALRLELGRRSDRLGRRLPPLRRISLLLVGACAAAALLLQAPSPLVVIALVFAGALAFGWNGLSFTVAAELAGRARAGVALGLQQTVLGVACTVTPLAFAAVAATSWQVAFALLAPLPLIAYAVLGPLERDERELEGFSTRSVTAEGGAVVRAGPFPPGAP